MRGVLPLVGLGLAMELGWLALWPLAAALSQSPRFTTEYLAAFEPARALLQTLADALGGLVPGLPAAASSPLTATPGDPIYAAPATALALDLLLLAGIYLIAINVLQRRGSGRPSAALVVGLASLVFQVTLLLQPGLLSQDVFSYITYGRFAADYGLNPYIWPPSALPKDPAVGWVASVWRTYACPYGPLWVDMQALLAHLTDSLPILAQALVYRACGLLALLGSMGLVWCAAPRAHRASCLALLAWNPLVLLEVVGDAHNDAWMLALALLGSVLLAGPRAERHVSQRLGATVALTLSVLVKYLSGLVLVWLVLAEVARRGVWRGLLLLLVSGTLALGLFAPWLELPDSFGPLINETVDVGYVNALPDHVALAAANHVLAPAGMARDEARAVARLAERVVTLAGFALYLLWEARRVWSTPQPSAVVRALARSMLIYLLIATAVQPWYYVLPVGLAAVLGWPSSLARVVVGYSLLAAPALYLSYYLRALTPEAVFVCYGLAPLLLLVPPALRRLQRGRGAAAWATAGISGIS